MYNNRVVVYISGTLDLFHSNHLKMIEYARGLGDTLIVGVSTDELQASYKNPPIIPFEERCAMSGFYPAVRRRVQGCHRPV